MTPIFKVQNGKQIDIHCRINDAQGPREVTIASNLRDETIANLIVRAYNKHEDLLKACKNARWYLAGFPGPHDKDLLKELKDAIAKATTDS